MKGALLAPLLALLHGGVASFVADARLPATWEAGKAERANTIKVNTRVYLRRRHRTHAGHPCSVCFRALKREADNMAPT